MRNEQESLIIFADSDYFCGPDMTIITIISPSDMQPIPRASDGGEFITYS